MVKLQALNMQFCWKTNFTTSVFQIICLPFKNTSFKENFKENSSNFEMQFISSWSSYITLHFQLFQLVLNWPMVDFLRNKDESLDWKVPAFKWKRNMGRAVRKYTAESIVHSIWKEYGNFIMSLLMPESTGLRDSTTRHNLYVFALSRFDIIKSSICIIFVIHPCSPYWRSVGADLGYPNLLPVEILQLWTNSETGVTPGLRFLWITNSSDLRRVWRFFKEVFKFWNFKALSFCARQNFSHCVQHELLLENYCNNLLVSE